MKKWFTLLLAAAGVVLFAAFAGAAALGDVDANGQAEAADARLALRAAVGLETLAGGSFRAADMDRSGKIDASDARAILRVAVGLETAGFLIPPTETVSLLPGGTAVDLIQARPPFRFSAASGSDEIGLKRGYADDGSVILFIIGYAECRNVPIVFTVFDEDEAPVEVFTARVSVAEDPDGYLNMAGMPFIPDFGAAIGLAPAETYGAMDGDGADFELRYSVWFSPDDAQNVFYAYQDLLEQLGYEFMESADGGWRQSYYYWNPDLHIRIAYLEDWSDLYGGSEVENVWITWRPMTEYAPG